VILVFTPTIQWGGLDVAFASVARQTCAKEILWLVADEHLYYRKHIYAELHERSKVLAVIPFKIPVRKGYARNLTSSYNEALIYARTMGVDLFVTMQDYIWIPPDGVEKFSKMAENYGRDLLTGLCSISDNPGVEDVVEPQGLFTIFKEPYEDKPRETWWWSDAAVRGAGRYPGIHEADPIQWEINWAAIPKEVLGAGIDFDPEYDKGIAYDHQDFAKTCQRELGSRVILDTTNHAIGLPHKLFFPKMTEENGTLVGVNRERMESKWG
jgi:hypothetical protein